MQGKLPCHDCPYGQLCDNCLELKVRAEGQKVKNCEQGGFYSQEVRIIKDRNGNEKFAYSHPE